MQRKGKGAEDTMEGRNNRETGELEIKLFPEETEKLNDQGWVYDRENDILILKSVDGFYSVFKNIEMRTPDAFTITLTE